MILALDCGNTSITVGFVDEARCVLQKFTLPTDMHETEFGYAAKIEQITKLLGIDISNVEGCAISSVVPPVTDALYRAMKLLTKKEIFIVGAGVKTGLHICINDPGTLAADLVTSAVAAKEEYSTPCIIVDMGSATTVTVLDGSKRFVGGAIYPGVAISLTSLAEKTALLPHIELSVPKSSVGLNTVECMKAGMVYGTAGAVDGIIDSMSSELGLLEPTVVATGGVSGMILPYMRNKAILDEDLMLKGLRIIWDKNKRKQG